MERKLKLFLNLLSWEQCLAGFHEAQKSLAGQPLKAIFALNKYLHKFTYLKPTHVLGIFDKLITPILNYGSEVWGFHKAPAVESVHLQFCKKLLGSNKVHRTILFMGS